MFISFLSLSLCPSSRLKQYSYPEKSFAESWLSSADFVAATHFQSTVERSVVFMTPLPSRVLREGDQAPNIQDLSPEENHTLSIFSWMRNMNSVLGRLGPNLSTLPSRHLIGPYGHLARCLVDLFGHVHLIGHPFDFSVHLTHPFNA